MEESSSLWNDIVPRVDPDKCRRCADCPPVAVCLAKSFRRDGFDSIPFVDGSICFGCYSCAQACPHRAVILPRSR